LAIVTVGIALAKNALVVHCVGAAGNTELERSEVPRRKFTQIIASFPPLQIGTEIWKWFNTANFVMPACRPTSKTSFTRCDLIYRIFDSQPGSLHTAS
jgi:hypothetical protein